MQLFSVQWFVSSLLLRWSAIRACPCPVLHVLLLSALFLWASDRQLMPVATRPASSFVWPFHLAVPSLLNGTRHLNAMPAVESIQLQFTCYVERGMGSEGRQSTRKDLVIIVEGRVVGGHFRLASPIVMKNVTTNSSRTCPFTMSFGFVRLLLHYTTTHYILQSRMECIAFTLFHANAAFTAPSSSFEVAACELSSW